MKIRLPYNEKKTNKLLILFDGECLMCNSLINFLDKHLELTAFAYSSQDKFFLDYKIYKKIMKSFHIEPDSTIVVFDDGNIYTHSAAISILLRNCHNKFLKVTAEIVFLFSYFHIGDIVYKFVSRYRKSIFRLPHNYCGLRTKSIVIK